MVFFQKFEYKALIFKFTKHLLESYMLAVSKGLDTVLCSTTLEPFRKETAYTWDAICVLEQLSQ
jgi:hypothetical protein